MQFGNLVTYNSETNMTFALRLCLIEGVQLRGQLSRSCSVLVFYLVCYHAYDTSESFFLFVKVDFCW